MRWLRTPIARIVIGIVMIAVATIAAGLLAEIVVTPVADVAVIAASIGAYAGFVRWLERRRLDELAPARASELAIGLALGAAIFAMTSAILWLLGVASFTAGADPRVLAMAMGALTAAVTEEIVFRGILFRILEASLGTWIALAISAALFGAAHLLNPHASAMAAIAIALEAGILLGAAFLVGRRLWLPIGMHAGWNFTESGVFGAPVSGTVSHGLLDMHVSGSELLTGDTFGPEASIVAIGVCLVAAAGLLVLARRRSP